MMSVIGERREMEHSKLANILRGPFKDRVRHLCRQLDLPEDPEGKDSPMLFWWMHCYQHRNEIVHRGADSMAPLSEAARIGLVQMVVDIREAIRNDNALADLGAMILWGRRIDDTGRGEAQSPMLLRPPPVEILRLNGTPEGGPLTYWWEPLAHSHRGGERRRYGGA
jgi:hypothetical protein